MKFIVKVLAEQIKESYAVWNSERDDIFIFGNNARSEYHALLKGTLITNYGMLNAMYINNVISFNEFKLLDRYNDRIKALYRKGI